MGFMWNTPWCSLCISRMPHCTPWRDKRRKETFLEKCKMCREVKCPWWLFWWFREGSGKPGLLVLSQPCPCSKIFPFCQQLQGQKTGGTQESWAVTWANSDTQSSSSTINPFLHLPRVHAAWKISQGLALFAFLNDYIFWEGRHILL